MTKEHREKLNYQIGKLEGLTWAVEDCAINEGLREVVTSLESLLKEDEKDEKTPDLKPNWQWRGVCAGENT